MNKAILAIQQLVRNLTKTFLVIMPSHSEPKFEVIEKK